MPSITEGMKNMAADMAGQQAGQIAADMAGQMATDMAGQMAADMAGQLAGQAAMGAAMDMAKDINEGKMPPPPEGMGPPPNGHQTPGGNPPPNQIEKKPDCRGLVFYMYQNFIKPNIKYFILGLILFIIILTRHSKISTRNLAQMEGWQRGNAADC